MAFLSLAVEQAAVARLVAGEIPAPVAPWTGRALGGVPDRDCPGELDSGTRSCVLSAPPGRVLGADGGDLFLGVSLQARLGGIAGPRGTEAAGDVRNLTEQRRGEPLPEPDQFERARALWLDNGGAGEGS